MDLGVSISETIATFPNPTNQVYDLGGKDVEFSYLRGDLTEDLSDTAVFEPQSQIYVHKEIAVWSVDPGDTANLTQFTQRFSQVSQVPEPTTLALMGLGLAGLGYRRKKVKVT